MSHVALERIEAQLAEVRQLMEKARGVRRTLYPLPEAAELLGVGMTKMRELVASRVVLTVQLGGRDMVPQSELDRVSRVDPPKMLTPKAKRLAASIAKIRAPIPGAREAAIRVRSTKNPPTQDSAALRRRR